MKIRFLRFIIFAMVLSNSSPNIYAQSKNETTFILPTGWCRYAMSNILQIDIPPTMEIQSGEFKKVFDNYYVASNMTIPDFVFQQKGLSELEQNAFNKYARIMIIINNNISDKFIDINSNIISVSNEKLKEIDNELKNYLVESFSQKNTKIIHWNTAKLTTVNNMSCVHYSFVRQLQNKPEVFVSSYTFEKNRTRYILTLSYRMDLKHIYQTDFQKLVNSFTLFL